MTHLWPLPDFGPWFLEAVFLPHQKHPAGTLVRHAGIAHEPALTQTLVRVTHVARQREVKLLVKWVWEEGGGCEGSEVGLLKQREGYHPL